MTRTHRTLAVAAAAALSAAIAVRPAGAEETTPITTTPVTTVPATVAKVPATVPATPASPAASLWRLPASPDAMRVDGEDGTLTVPVYLPPGATREAKRFQLTYQAAISVMPEASWLTLTVNGHTIGRVPIAAPTSAKRLFFDLPAGTLTPGWNAVQIGISQRHRVDCSIEATYELWTQIDPARSGFSGIDPTMESLDDLPALAVDTSGATRLHLLLPANAAATDIERAVAVAERVALRGRFNHPVVDTVPAPDGLTIAVGTQAALAATLGTAPPSAASAVSLGTTKQGGPLLTVSGFTEAELDRAVAELEAVPRPAGTPEGLQALATARGARIRPGEAASLADLGVRTATFSGRLFRTGFDIVLPPDAFPADYGEARFTFDGGYSAGLTRDARLIIRVNGIINGNLDLDRPGGAALQGQVIHMPLTAFRPGRNRIEIQAELPARSDLSCDTLTSINAKERFLILGSSTLAVPRLARIAQFPNLSATMVGNFRITPDAPPQLFLTRQTPEAVAAAATLMVNAALGSGVPTNAVIRRGPPQPGEASAVILGTSTDITPSLLEAAGVDAATVASAWSGRPVPARNDITGAIPTPWAAGDSADMDRLDAWGQQVDRSEGWYGPAGATIEWLRGLAVGSLQSAGLMSYPDRPVAVTGDMSMLMAQGLRDGTALTVVAARDDEALAAGAAAVTDPVRVAQLAGRAATLAAAGGSVDLVAARSIAFFRTAPFSVGNERLIAAGWVSSNAGWYIGLALLATMTLGIATWATLAFSRRGA